MSSRAQTVFVNGAVYTGGLAEPDARVTGLAVADGRILALGGADELAELTGPDTEVVDLAGGLVLPGFVDAHIHPVEGGLELMRCDLSGAATREQYLAIIRDYAEANPELPWILGGGWQVAAFPGGAPLATDLDAVIGDRPAFLSNRDHHGAWVSSRALEIAGLRADTPDPADGRIERDANGAPSGTLHEGARTLVTRHIPADTTAEETEALLTAQKYLHSLGITGWQDAIVGDYGSHSDTGPVYLEAARSGALTARVVAALWWERSRGVEQIPELVARREALEHPRFRATSIKIMQDGIPENYTAGMLEPYLDASGAPTLGTGLSFVDPIELRRDVTELDRAGFQVHIHAIGDRAVRESLDAIEAARAANGDSGIRHHLAHVQVVHPDDLARFAPLGATVNMQALWANWEPQNELINLVALGAERSSWQYPFAQLWNAGAVFCAGSDWPVTTPDPWAAIQVAVTRRLPHDDADYNPKPFYPGSALSLAQALSAYTQGSARINAFEPTGTLEPGAVADLAVVDRNPFAGSVDAISDTRTASTWIDGVRVHTT
ncbi:amidohydrolase [Schumannella soli]|uniref:Amidohydrolase n=1 Tax=Schumannella soli TaxID=2590779 RepID=A0A506Y2C1_9MICO|nr:amidohydrolase [Schumannella soli]TPW74549.1 amidohydrolase [Schumannella soli]